MHINHVNMENLTKKIKSYIMFYNANNIHIET